MPPRSGRDLAGGRRVGISARNGWREAASSAATRRRHRRRRHQWHALDAAKDTFEGKHRKSGQPRWTATRADLIFGSNAQLRAVAEVYGSSDGQAKFVKDFVAAWGKVMDLDRYDAR